VSFSLEQEEQRETAVAGSVDIHLDGLGMFYETQDGVR
jgi:hypothetical protein